MERTVETRSPEETEAFGEALGRRLRRGDVVALVGDLGSGKTCLTRGIARGLASPDRVASPTFVLIHEYTLPDEADAVALYHFDLYRLGGAAELEDIGGVELLYGDGVSVIEWAERAEGLLPPHTIRVELDVLDESRRRIRLRASDRRFDGPEGPVPDSPEEEDDG